VGSRGMASGVLSLSNEQVHSVLHKSITKGVRVGENSC